MKTMMLEWKTPEEIPDRRTTIIVAVDDKLYKYGFFSTISIEGKKVYFFGKKVKAWAYYNPDFFDSFISISKFDPEWVNFLHDNALK